MLLNVLHTRPCERKQQYSIQSVRNITTVSRGIPAKLLFGFVQIIFGLFWDRFGSVSGLLQIIFWIVLDYFVNLDLHVIFR